MSVHVQAGGASRRRLSAPAWIQFPDRVQCGKEVGYWQCHCYRCCCCCLNGSGVEGAMNFLFRSTLHRMVTRHTPTHFPGNNSIRLRLFADLTLFVRNESYQVAMGPRLYAQPERPPGLMMTTRTTTTMVAPTYLQINQFGKWGKY